MAGPERHAIWGAAPTGHVTTRGATITPSKPNGVSMTSSLLRFLFEAMSGMGAANLGWEKVTDPKARLSDIALDVPLCLAPPAIVATWAPCLFGIAQHHPFF